LEKLLLRVGEAAELASVSRTTAYELVARGSWPCVRVGEGGTGVRVVYSALVEWIEANTRCGRGEGPPSKAA
jgi:excisionase family DNA binding protein